MKPKFDFRQRHLGLDILRGVAILMVVFHHADEHLIPEFAGFGGSAVWEFGFWRVKNLGWSGVDMFFVLSGFLIGGLLMNEIDKSGEIRIGRFYFKRAFKILPSYLALVFTLAITGAVAITAAEWPVFLLFLQNYLSPLKIGPTWSLAVEEHFYLLLPLSLTLLVLLEGKLRRGRLSLVPWLVAAVVVACFAMRCWRATQGDLAEAFMMSHFRFDGLLIGVLCQYFWREHQHRVETLVRYWWVAIPFALVLIAPAMFWFRSTPLMFSVGFLGLSIGYAVILLIVVKAGVPYFESTLAGKTVAAIGRWSYNIYLWHFFILALAVPGYAPIQQSIASAIGYAPAAALLQIGVLTAYSVAIGWLATKVVEEPALKLRTWLLNRQTKPQPGATAVG